MKYAILPQGVVTHAYSYHNKTKKLYFNFISELGVARVRSGINRKPANSMGLKRSLSPSIFVIHNALCGNTYWGSTINAVSRRAVSDWKLIYCYFWALYCTVTHNNFRKRRYERGIYQNGSIEAASSKYLPQWKAMVPTLNFIYIYFQVYWKNVSITTEVLI